MHLKIHPIFRGRCRAHGSSVPHVWLPRWSFSIPRLLAARAGPPGPSGQAPPPPKSEALPPPRRVLADFSAPLLAHPPTAARQQLHAVCMSQECPQHLQLARIRCRILAPAPGLSKISGAVGRSRLRLKHGKTLNPKPNHPKTQAQTEAVWDSL